MPQGSALLREQELTHLLGLGSNIVGPFGRPEAALRAAVAALAGSGLRIVAASRVWRTPAFPPGAGPDFANAAVAVQGLEDPWQMLALLHGIEAAHGRERRERWGARTLDLDLVASGGRVLPDAATVRRWIALPPDRQVAQAPGELILPHPRLQDRAFVLAPLAEIAPDWRHPLLGLSITAMLAACPDAERTAMSPLHSLWP